MELEGHETTHILVFVDEAGFNLSKGRRRGRNLTGHRATTDTPGQRGTNITMCAAISENGVSTHLPHIGPYNTQLLLVFLNTLYRDLTPEQEKGLVRPHLPNYVVVWDNISFHRTNIVRDWFAARERITVEFLPPYSPFLNPIEEYFQNGGGKTTRSDVSVGCHECCMWGRHSWSLQGMGAAFKEIFPRCMAMENIRCDVDENLWPDQQERQDPPRIIFMDVILYFCVFVVI